MIIINKKVNEKLNTIDQNNLKQLFNIGIKDKKIVKKTPSNAQEFGSHLNSFLILANSSFDNFNDSESVNSKRLPTFDKSLLQFGQILSSAEIGLLHF